MTVILNSNKHDKKAALLEFNFVLYEFIKPVPVATLSEAKALIAWTLGSWVTVPLNAWMFVLCCPVHVDAFETG
jgi:hypothetical protein